MKIIRFIDLFAGIGGFRYGLSKVQVKSEDSTDSKSRTSQYGQCPFRCVWSNEWDKYATQIYNKNFSKNPQPLSEVKQNSQGGNGTSNKDRPNSLFPRHIKRTSDRVDTRDIRTVKSSEIPDFDLLVGGFPCQAFSIAGKRRGFDDTRGTLFFEIARILADKRPRYFILENVKGLLSHDEGKTFQTILGVLSDLGYDYQWQVLNSKNFGVPQNRERVFIVGNLRGTPRPKVFPVSEAVKGDGEVELRHHATRQISPTVRTPSGGYHTPTIRYPIKFAKRNQRNIKGDYSFTVDTSNTGGVRQEMKVRRLTPVECERLQGFPDDWTQLGGLVYDKKQLKMKNEAISDTQRYKCLGNAVTTNVVTWIAEQLLK